MNNVDRYELMATTSSNLVPVRQRTFLAGDFDSFRATLLRYAQLYYPDRIKDFSESSVGGMLLDLASFVGDNLSFYLTHAHGELNPQTAVEPLNIERHLNQAGVQIVGSSPAIAPVTIFVQVPAIELNGTVEPDLTVAPIVHANSIFEAKNGTQFLLAEDVNFVQRRSDGTLLAEVRVGQRTSSGVPTSFIMAASGLAISGEETSEVIPTGSTFVPFKRITLTNPSVSEIISVTDDLGNTYYRVEHLTHDVVYRNVLNTSLDTDLVKDSLKIIPAPFRYTVNVDLNSRRTTMTLGGGDARTLEDDVIPDPSEFAIAFPYSRTFSRIPLNPNQLLNTKTLGVYAVDTSLTVTYRHGGGLSHNVPVDSIQNVVSLKMTFPNNPSPARAGAVRSSVEVTNRIAASGGEDPPSTDDLVALLPAIKNSQERVVTREDLIARVYTIPSNFGRVFRAAIRSNPNNPLATQLFIVSRNSDNELVTSPDTLKRNLVRYLNPYRAISDAIDILDARIVNLKVTFDVLVDPTLNRAIVLQNVLTKLQRTFDIKNFNIDQPIVTSDVMNVIHQTPGIISINDLVFENVTGVHGIRTYSDVVWNLSANVKHGIYLPPPGGIFEVRHPEINIIGRASA